MLREGLGRSPVVMHVGLSCSLVSLLMKQRIARSLAPRSFLQSCLCVVRCHVTTARQSIALLERALMTTSGPDDTSHVFRVTVRFGEADAHVSRRHPSPSSRYRSYHSPRGRPGALRFEREPHTNAVACDFCARTHFFLHCIIFSPPSHHWSYPVMPQQ